MSQGFRGASAFGVTLKSRKSAPKQVNKESTFTRNTASSEFTDKTEITNLSATQTLKPLSKSEPGRVSHEGNKLQRS